MEEMMSVLLEAFNIIVRSATVTQRYPGGVTHYFRNRPRGTCLDDCHLVGIGFRLQNDAADHFDRLILRYRFAPDDIAFVHRLQGVLTPRDWIKWARHGNARSICWLCGTDPHEIVHPASPLTRGKALRRPPRPAGPRVLE
jgi:hypothetical protein